MSAALQWVLDDVAARQPRVHELAAYASLAARIEAPLLRRLRQQLLPPDADPGLEADLWFSPLIESFDADACVLHPWIAEQLRTVLKQSGRLAAVWAIVGEAHAAVPPWQRLEEEVAYLTLTGDGEQAAQALRAALKAMVDSPERGVQVARWAMHALPRLPQQAAAWPEARALEQGMHARIAVLGAAARWADAPVFDHVRHGWVLPAAATTQPVAEIGLRVDGEALVVCDAMQVAAEARLQIPDSRTRRLQVRSTDVTGRLRYAALRGRPGQRVVFEGSPRDIEITTEAGAVHGLEPVVEAGAAAAAVRAIDAYRYPLFISAASRDRQWVSRFRDALDDELRSLTGRPRGTQMSFWDARDLSAAANFSTENEWAIEESFAFLLFVNESSVTSAYCRREFQEFVRSAGSEGLQGRLHVVAMSEPAIRQWQADTFWRQHMTDDLANAWTPFFDPSAPDRPLPLTEEYSSRLSGLARHLADQMWRRAPPAHVAAAATPPAPARPRVQIGVVSLELDGPTASLRRRLRVDLGLEAHSCNREALYSDFPEFTSADLLLLPFNDSQPLVATVAVGGHLALQRDAWLRHGKPADALLWVDMRDVPAAQPVFKEHAGFIAEIAAASVKREAVLARLGGAEEPAADIAPEVVHLYIGSNSEEPDSCRMIGDALKRRWKHLPHGHNTLELRELLTKTLDQWSPFQRSERVTPFDDDAAGVVLLWYPELHGDIADTVSNVDSLLDSSVPRGLAVTGSGKTLQRRSLPGNWSFLRFGEFGDKPLDFKEVDRFLDSVLRRKLAQRNRSAPA